MKRLWRVIKEVEVYVAAETEDEAQFAAEEAFRDDDSMGDATPVSVGQRLGEWADALPWGGDDTMTCSDYLRQLAEVEATAEAAKASPLRQVNLDGSEGPTRENAEAMKRAEEPK